MSNQYHATDGAIRRGQKSVVWSSAAGVWIGWNSINAGRYFAKQIEEFGFWRVKQ